MSDEMKKVADEAAKALYEIDGHLTKARKAAERVAASVEMGAALGMARPLKAAELVARAHQLTGEIASVAAFKAVLHQDLTKVATDNGVDTPALPDVGGIVITRSGAPR